jgi:hypothetical protein
MDVAYPITAHRVGTTSSGRMRVSREGTPFLTLRFLTNRNAVPQQSPGSRSAPWVTETTYNQTPTGFYTVVCKTRWGLRRVSIVTPGRVARPWALA